MLRQKRETGSLERLPPRAGAKQVLTTRHREWWARQIKDQPEATLAELREQLAKEKDVSVSPATLCRALHALRLLRKKSR